ncbi:helix-turn-helix domain-containing protein [Geoalkalibacter subterraneus]|uniref:HTH cro/C1-type domain-containing protein n=1 Tax=Geoalkalibacter subterraneus TaxID=483547 RepID=A0A0B5FUF2_9BACT|nr:helix-turn-helix transcriptional regulator [Geoalkalibacter subterraneus]AJF08274.1 hypothetical protein GSUB_17510 [Geoalkalibacter subterraneus]
MNNPLGEYLKKIRLEKDIGLRELCDLIEKDPRCGVSVSPSYYSQIETGNNLRLEKITFDKIWAIAIVLGIDPIGLFILSRPQIPQYLAKKRNRHRLFPAEL